jgi:hypothetical protein
MLSCLGPHADLIGNPAQNIVVSPRADAVAFAARRLATAGLKPCLRRRFGHTVRATGCGNHRGAKK